jgi:ABC-type cobalt transport system substrate-binding protein
MKVQSKKFKVQWYGRIIFILVSLFTACCMLSDRTFAAGKWQGVDESVVQKVAKENGREARPPLINTDQGDLLLFVFLLAGAIGGFTAGYYWRVLMVGRTKKKEKEGFDDI